MATKWKISKSENLSQLIERYQYNLSVTNSTEQEVPVNFRNDKMWTDTKYKDIEVPRLSAPDEYTTDGITMSEVADSIKEDYYYKFKITISLAGMGEVLASAFYNWKGNSDMELIASYIKSGIPGIDNVPVTKTSNGILTKGKFTLSNNNSTLLYKIPEGNKAIIDKIYILGDAPPRTITFGTNDSSDNWGSCTIHIPEDQFDEVTETNRIVLSGGSNFKMVCTDVVSEDIDIDLVLIGLCF